MSNIFEELSEENYQAGIVMVKPHAYGQVLDPLVRDTLGSKGLAHYLAPCDPLVAHLNNISIGNLIVRDLSRVPYGNELLDIFYSDKIHTRYYPLIREWYLGKVAFIPYLYEGTVEEFSDVPDAIKGIALGFDRAGNQLFRPRGLRGIFCKPYEFISRSASQSLSDSDYRRYFEPVVNNCIHVCDSSREISSTFERLMKPRELRNILSPLIPGGYLERTGSTTGKPQALTIT